MQAQNFKQVKQTEVNEEQMLTQEKVQQNHDDKLQIQATPILQKEINHKQTKDIDDSNSIDQNNQQNEQICHKLSQAAINSPVQKRKQQLSQKQIIHFSQKQLERGYIESIQQIKQILNNKELSQVKFIQKILKNFSHFVFNNDDNKKQEKQHDPFDSQVSFDQQGQEINKSKKQDDSSTLIIDQDFFDTEQFDILWENKLVKNMFKYNAIFHCRIVFVLYVLTSNKYSFQKAYNIRLSKNLSQLKQKLQQNNIRYSFDRNIWTQQRESNLKKQVKKNESNNINLNIISQLQKNDLFRKVDHLYTKLGFKDSDHPFNKKMTILNQQMYRLRYMKQFAYYSFSTAEDVFKFLKQQNSQRFKNIQFYSDKLKATSRKLNLSQIHNNKATDYEWLQRSHDYIQWLFPNHFRSQFNSSSFPLGYIQAQIFKNDQKLRKLLLRSFQIFLDFMGCSIKYLSIPKTQSNEKKQEIINVKVIIIIANNDKRSIERLKSCLIYNTHNHLRIMRILACLSVIGLRNYAEAFLKFVNGLKKNPNINFSLIKNSLQKNWNVYLSVPQNKQRALQMCFIPYLNFISIKIDDTSDQGIRKEIKPTMQDQNDHGKKKMKLDTQEK